MMYITMVCSFFVKIKNEHVTTPNSKIFKNEKINLKSEMLT